MVSFFAKEYGEPIEVFHLHFVEHEIVDNQKVVEIDSNILSMRFLIGI